MKLRKLILSILFVITAIFLVDVSSTFASTADTLVVHYHRYDDTYSTWDMWLWPDDGEGTDYAFNGNDTFGKTATITLSGTDLDGTDAVGILIKDTTWNKDWNDDRFIDMTNPNVSGEVHVYFLQGEEYFSYVESDEPTCNSVTPDPTLCAVSMPSGLVDVFINENLKVEFLATESISSSDITIYEDGTPVTFSGFTSGPSGELILDTTVDLAKTYSIEVDFTSETIESNIRFDFDYDSVQFNEAYNYNGTLGYEYTELQTTFKLWAPVSSAVELNLYMAGHQTSSRADGVNDPYQVIELEYLEKGVWTVTVLGDLNGVYYTYNVVNSGTKVSDIQDPYGVSFGLNGLRSMVLDLDATDPLGWNTDTGIDGYTNPSDAIIYELHVRDLTSAGSWGGPDEYQGKYMGITVENTTFTHPLSGITVSTGLDHLIELGITHLHLLPTYDQDWNDEVNPSFNWGYNPQHYNAPEGGYATDPFDGAVRVNEYKQMVMALHSNGINVINDVVYNHTGPGAQYSFNKIVPSYFYRYNTDGSWSNGSGVGNETASERYMVNKFIVDSVEYWAEEFHIDGFRFDLMSVHDYQTMNDVANKVEAIDPDIFVYGEPWGGGDIALAYSEQAGKHNLVNMPLISAFNDGFRDSIKGSVWNESESGYVTDGNSIYDVMNGISGSQLGTVSWQSVNYVSAHDNSTLYDKLLKANGYTDYNYYQDVDYQSRLANSIVLLSQGIPFLHAGSDFLRTKLGDHNSYESSDLVNQLSYVRKASNIDTFNYYRGIIEIRKNYDSFKMSDRTDINNNLDFLYPEGFGMIGYNLTKNDENILVYHNAGVSQNDITLPSGAWKLIANRDEAGLLDLGTYETRYPIEKAETLIFVQGDSADVISSPLHKPVITNNIGIMYEGGKLTITASTSIHSYSLNGGTDIVVATPATSVEVLNLTEGSYIISIKDEFGTESDPFTLTVLAPINPLVCETGFTDVNGACVKDEPLVCEIGFSEVDGACVEDEALICETGETLINDECVTLPQPLVCNDDETVVDGACVPNSDNSLLIYFGVGGLLAGLGVLLYFFRKRV